MTRQEVAGRNIIQLLDWWADQKPDGTAISFEGVDVSREQLARRSSRLAYGLRAMGVHPGDRVAVFGDNSIAWIESALAVLTCGAAVVPVNTKLAPQELSVLLAHSRLKAVLHAPALENALEAADGPAKHERLAMCGAAYEAMCLSGDALGTTDVRDDAPAVIGYTSGTTGAPKGVVLTHASIYSLLQMRQVEDVTFTSEVRSLSLQPMFFTACFTLHCLPTLMVGGTFYLMDGLRPTKLLKTLEEARINNLWAVPLVYADLAAEEGFARADLSNLVSLCTGGTRVSTEILASWHAKGLDLRQGYGCTEVGGIATLARPAAALEHPERAGVPMPGVRTRVVDSSGLDASIGKDGELLVKSPSLMKEYLFDTSATENAFTKDGWLRTGDIARKFEDGSIAIVARSKDMIISGGANIYPSDVETVVSSFPGVEEVAVVAAFHPRWDEVPVAIVFGRQALSPDSIVEHCRANLQRYAVPARVIIADAPLPKTASGKIHKPTLRSVYAGELS